MAIKHFPVAILQGRLSPDFDGRYQFFPKTEWEKEFEIAKTLGFDGIEWLIDPKEWKSNPIFTRPNEVKVACRGELGVPVTSICADWFMDVCLWEGDPEEHRAAIFSLVEHLALTTQRTLLIPLLETHSIFDEAIQEKVVSVLKPLASEFESKGLSIGFETELSITALTRFIDMFESNVFGAYYDIGNCTSYGFDCGSDIKILGEKVKGIHIKDRKVGATTPLPLGSGDADYLAVFEALTFIEWSGVPVMQAWRGTEYTKDAQNQLTFIRNIINA